MVNHLAGGVLAGWLLSPWRPELAAELGRYAAIGSPALAE